MLYDKNKQNQFSEAKSLQKDGGRIMQGRNTWRFDSQKRVWIYAWIFKKRESAWKRAYAIAPTYGLQDDHTLHVVVESTAENEFIILATREPTHNPPYRNYKVPKQIVDGTLQCSKCGKWKIVAAFGPSKITSTGYASWCQQCWKLNQLYHITSEEYDGLLEAQGGTCAICGSADPKARDAYFQVDQDRVSGRVRGLLCSSCHTALRGFHEDIALLVQAITYLRSHELAE